MGKELKSSRNEITEDEKAAAEDQRIAEFVQKYDDGGNPFWEESDSDGEGAGGGSWSTLLSSHRGFAHLGPPKSVAKHGNLPAYYMASKKGKGKKPNRLFRLNRSKKKVKVNVKKESQQNNKL
uniref:Uncharacterized protein n=1 Tax=Globodera rostochiensis TaxID=31243 RepID=A0A914HZK5_GLORO